MQRAQGMFGNVAACRHVLGRHHRAWMAALCGSCLAVRDGSGQLSRATVSTDAVAAAVLAHEVGGVAVDERRAGPCALRGLRTASVWTGPGAAVGAAVSLLAAGIALGDHVADAGSRPVRIARRPLGRAAERLLADGTALATDAGLDPDAIVGAVARSRAAEQAGATDLAAWCGPVEDAYAAAFARSGLDGVGAAVGRATLLADAVADLDDDARTGAANPILAGACTRDEAVALVEHDLVLVSSTVAEARPGSLSAALWGPAWRNGLSKAVGRSLAAPVAVGAVGLAMTPMAGGGRRRNRDRAEDACDCCCCACCCCDLCDLF